MPAPPLSEMVPTPSACNSTLLVALPIFEPMLIEPPLNGEALKLIFAPVTPPPDGITMLPLASSWKLPPALEVPRDTEFWLLR